MKLFNNFINITVLNMYNGNSSITAKICLKNHRLLKISHEIVSVAFALITYFKNNVGEIIT